MPSFRQAGLRPVATAIAMWLALQGHASAQAVSESSLKAAFLYNFAKFTEWPADAAAPGTPLTICVIGDGAMLGILQQVVAGRPIDGREVRLLSMAADGALTSCHILYVPGDEAHRDAAVLERVGASPVLTVGDTERFVKSGGVSRLFVENGRMRFAINMSATHRARLQISSKVLALGIVVRDEGHEFH